MAPLPVTGEGNTIVLKKGLSTLAGNNPGDIWTMLRSNLDKEYKALSKRQLQYN